jgi:biofilm PGA synthesis N-glycosyltransferase PgaC
MGTIYIIGGAAGAFRKEIFNELGNYNTTNITEDIELTMRIQDAGKKIVYASDSVVFTEGASDISGLKNQRLRWKRGRFQTFYSYWYMFGSLKKRHNKFLSWLVLPLALFSEIQLAFEIPFIGFLFIYSLFSKDYSSFISGIIVVSSMFFFLLAFEDKNIRRFSFFALAPIAWFLFYVMTYVEASSLKNSIQTLLKGQNVGWQKWDRKGVVN